MKIVLDTNILIAAIGRKSPFRWIFDCLIEGKLALCVSNEILFEYREILERKTTKEIAENIVNFILVSPFTVKTEIYYNFHLLTADQDDNKFVDCAIASGAVCIVSNDSHFSVLKTTDFPRVGVLTMNEFSSRYRESLTRTN